MKKFFMKLTAIAVMPMLLAACTKDEVNPTPTNGGKEGEIELILKNESVADGTRAFGSGTTESWEKSISSAVLIVYNTSGTQILRRVLTAAEVNGSTTTPIKFVLPGVSADASCDFYVVINRNMRIISPPKPGCSQNWKATSPPTTAPTPTSRQRPCAPEDSL